jgi:hypothetical protein
MPEPLLWIRSRKDERWSIVSTDFAALSDALGADVLAGFCRCFAHADRLTSLTGFACFSRQEYAETSTAFGRDLQTMVWFVVGTLRELATAIRELRSALAKRDKSSVGSAPWIILREIERRWEDDAFYREMRNKHSYHVDPQQTTTGLQRLRAADRVVLIAGEGSQQRRTSLRLGLEALFMGSEMDRSAFDRFMARVADDHGAIIDAIQLAFIEVLEHAGIDFREMWE